MDANMEELKKDLDAKWALMGLKKKDATAEKIVEMVDKKAFQASKQGPMNKIDKAPLNPRIFS